MTKQNVYRELNRKLTPIPAREVKIDWAHIESDDSADPWDEETIEATPWEQAFELGAEIARDEYFDDEEEWS